MRVLGLMSGTSADGVDAVLATFSGDPRQPQWTLLNQAFVPYPTALHDSIVEAGQGKALSSGEWLDLAEAITEVQAKAAQHCDASSSAKLVGCHGQTLWHRPPRADQRGASWQVLQAPLLAQLLNKPVVHDFRAADLALGGQGAPLVPMADAALMGRIGGWRALLNLGGIANLSLIPPSSGPDADAAVKGWDSGPANSLVDLAMTKISSGRFSFDRDGAMAARGRPDEAVIQNWLKEAYFQVLPPKSTGRELFGAADTNRRLAELGALAQADQIATLTAFTAAVVAQDLHHLQTREQIRPVELVVAGGGGRNPVLMHALRQRCRGLRLRLSDEIGIPSEAREALAFALLAWWYRLGIPGNAPAITGAQQSAVLGVIAQPA